MPAIHIDYSAISVAEISTEQTDGTAIETTAYIIPVLIPTEEAAAWLALYDPTSSSSPAAADSRSIARPVMDALSRKVNE